MSNFRETANPYKGRDRGANRRPGPENAKGGAPPYKGATDGADVEWERTHKTAIQNRPTLRDARPEKPVISETSSGTPKTGTSYLADEDPDTFSGNKRDRPLNNPRTGRAQKFKGFGHGGDLLQQKVVAAKLRGGG